MSWRNYQHKGILVGMLMPSCLGPTHKQEGEYKYVEQSPHFDCKKTRCQTIDVGRVRLDEVPGSQEQVRDEPKVSVCMMY